MADEKNENPRIAVLWGGWSAEREISHDSAEACAEALGEAGYAQVDLLDVAEPDFPRRFFENSYDVAFIAMHGSYGEDGCIQGLCEIYHIPYTFSDVKASAVAADKHLSKIVFRRAAIPTPDDVIVHSMDELDVDFVCEELGLPLFVKPVTNGSSYGITKVHTKDELGDAVETALEYSDGALIEAAVDGVEITVPVIGTVDPEALPVIEIHTGAEFYDLQVKYEPSSMHHVIPANLPESVLARAQAYAVAAHKALGCRDASRSDFIVRSTGNAPEDMEPVILETNTIPGMTGTSLVPDSARHAGIEFPDLCKRFVEEALLRSDWN